MNNYVPMIGITAFILLFTIGGASSSSLAHADDFVGFNSDGDRVFEAFNGDITVIGTSDPFPERGISDIDEAIAADRQQRQALDILTNGGDLASLGDLVGFDGHLYYKGYNKACYYYVNLVYQNELATADECRKAFDIDPKVYKLTDAVSTHLDKQLMEFFGQAGEQQLNMRYYNYVNTLIEQHDPEKYYLGEDSDHIIKPRDVLAGHIPEKSKAETMISNIKLTAQYFLQEMKWKLTPWEDRDPELRPSNEVLYNEKLHRFDILEKGWIKDTHKYNDLLQNLEKLKVDLAKADKTVSAIMMVEDAPKEEVKKHRETTKFIMETQYGTYEKVKQAIKLAESIDGQSVDFYMKTGNYQKVIELASSDELTNAYANIKLGNTIDYDKFGNKWTLQLKGWEAFENGQYARAMEYFEAVKKLNSESYFHKVENNISSDMGLARSYQMLEQYDRAAYYFFMNMDRSDAMNGYAYSNFMVGNYDTAIHYYRLGVDNDISNIDSRNGLGMTYRTMGDCESADIEYAFAHNLNPDNTDTLDGIERMEKMCQ